MILDITNKCQMGCSHCMMSSDMNGAHMDIATVGKAFEFIKSLSPFVLSIAGGEPTLHPNIIEILDYAVSIMGKERVVLLSNGLFFQEDKALADKIMARGINIQVTNDKRFYPRDVSVPNRPNIMMERNLRVVDAFGRAKQNNLKEIGVLYNRTAPICFNIVNVAKKGGFKSLRETLLYLEARGKFCSLRIDVNGDIGIGESNECITIGNVLYDADNSAFNRLKSVDLMGCNKCNLVEKVANMF